MKNYGEVLESEVFNKLKKSKDAENEEKRKEMEMALQKKNEYDNINMSNYEKKKQIQKMLADDYEAMIRMKINRNQYDKITDLQNGQMAINKASQEMNYLKETENEKKKIIKELLINDKLMHDGQKNIRRYDEMNGVNESKKQNEELERRQRERDMAFVSRYNKFNEFQNKAAQSYNETVLKSTLEKDMKMNAILRKQEMEAKRKAEHEAELKNKAKKDMAMDTRFGIEKQIKMRNDNTQATVAEHRYYEDNTRAIERDLNNLNSLGKAEKKARQLQYKAALDNQAKTKEHMRMYGNMTGIEKQMNKNDLIAFKHYDNKTYALIPGLNSLTKSPSKKVAEEKMTK
uniref:Uncharacterized protein n=1 Tax=Euplotes harpa TaxID=151035 RepID=A0A7S3NC75_9SPIT|mmetsp:Transcript_35560/g.41152  ORF Transcript_35560/g.41152 Transcript_35560/m.41152 type:complete len:345 (+) Transcript_35560:243-1277(+)